MVNVKASPASPGANVVLQLKLRERFGWWPVARARLDKRSRAALTVRRYGGGPARVVHGGRRLGEPAVAEPRVQTVTPYASVNASRA